MTHARCPSPQVTLVGVDGMMTQFLTELGALVATAAGGTGVMAGPGLNDTHWDYIYNVGTKVGAHRSPVAVAVVHMHGRIHFYIFFR